MDQDRRNYFRIEDEISLVYQVVPQNQVPHVGTNIDSYYDFRFSLLSHLNDIDSKVQTQLDQIREQSPNVAEYLKAINKKFELLAKLMIFEDTPPEQHTQQVSLSAGGLAFKTNQKVLPGNLLEIKFVIYPSLLGVMVFGKVVDCREIFNDDDGYQYTIAIEYEKIKETDREMLIRHILRKQVQQIKHQREQSADDYDETTNAGPSA